jgi:glycosyltransferase involved in cell wall biosynthesis
VRGPSEPQKRFDGVAQRGETSRVSFSLARKLPSSPVNVLLVTHRYPPDGVGGVERYVESLCGELRQVGDRVAVLTRTPTHWPRRPRLRAADGIFRIVGSGVRLDQPLAHARALDRMQERVLDEVAPEIVHVNQLIGLSPSVLPMARAKGAAVVLTLHDYYFACPLAHLEKRNGESCDGPAGGLECERACFSYQPSDERWRTREAQFRSLLSAADVVTSPAHSVASYFEQHTGGAVRPVVVPYGTWVQPDASLERRRPTNTLRLAVLGTVARHKGVHVVIEALRLAALEQPQLIVWGRVDDVRYVEQLRVAGAGIRSLTFEVGGEYMPSQIGGLLREVDIVIVPSQVREASPIVPREALAHGVPVLAARIGGLPELITEGVNGMTFDPAAPAELAALLQRLAREPGLLQALAQGARETAGRSAADHAREMRELFVGALSARAA